MVRMSRGLCALAASALIPFGLCAKAKITPLHFDAFSVRFTYKAGGQRASEVQKETGATYVFPGTYFCPKQMLGVDLTIINGKRLCPYLQRKRRPVLAISEDGARIVRPNACGAIELRAEETFVLAGDSKTQRPKAHTFRHMIALTPHGLVDIQLTASERGCRKLMTALGYSKYLFMDGGSTGTPNKKIPSHIIAVPTKLA